MPYIPTQINNRTKTKTSSMQPYYANKSISPKSETFVKPVIQKKEKINQSNNIYPFGVSVCISAWKTAEYIEECLDSVANQTWFKNHDNWEILLGIDGCEETLAKVKEIMHKYKNLKVMMMDHNVGTYVTCNTIMKEARYEWLLRFDSDDTMPNDMISKIFANDLKNVSAIRYEHYDFGFGNNCGLAWGSHLIKHSVFNRFGGYRNWRISADFDLLYRIEPKCNILKLSSVFYNRRVRLDGLQYSPDTDMKSAKRLELKKFILEKSRNECIIHCITEKFTYIFDNVVYGIIGLTTWKKRIGYVYKTIETLEKNKGFKIVMTLSSDEFANKEKDLPKSLYDYVERGVVEIIWVEKNYRSFKKVLFAMDKYRTLPVITADDDALYPNDYCKKLYLNYSNDRKNIYYNSPGKGSGFGYIFPPYIFKSYPFVILDSICEKYDNDDLLYMRLADRLGIKRICLNDKKGIYFHDQIEPIDMKKRYANPNYKKEESDFYTKMINSIHYDMNNIKQKLQQKAQSIGFRDFNIDNPKTWCEKMAWLQINDNAELRAKCADKIKVHEYSIEKLGKDICVPIIKVYDNPNEIDFSELPDKFVLKCNHGYAFNIICRDKSKLNQKDCQLKLQKWLNTSFGQSSIELHYLKIKRKCYAETFIENAGHKELIDYKFWCFDGVPRYVKVLNGRNTNDFHLNYYDMNFNFMNICQIGRANNPSKLDKKPEHFEQMKEYAKKLSEDFHFVRVDFYEVDGVVYLGELTFTPATGFIKWTDPNIDRMFGDMIKLN